MKSLNAMPFDSNEVIDPQTGATSYDRVAYSKDLADWLSTYFSNGILAKGSKTIGDELKVTHKEGLTISVGPGAVCINGRTGWNEGNHEETLSIGGSNPRIDRIVAELNIPNDRDIYIKVLEGTPAEEPTAPELIQSDDVYQIPLAQVRVDAGSATVAEIIDERADYISNVTIGIKPPTGNDAEAVRVSDEVAATYGLKDIEKNVDKALLKPSFYASYMGFVTNTNTDSLDASFGKNNEDIIKGIGKALAMYAWFKGDSKEEYPFSEMQKADTLNEVLNSKKSLLEFLSSSNLTSLKEASPYANSINPELPVLYSLYDSEKQTYSNGMGNFTFDQYYNSYSLSSNVTFTAYKGTEEGETGGSFKIEPYGSSSYRISGGYAKSPTFTAKSELLVLKNIRVYNHSQSEPGNIFAGLELYKSDGTLVESWGGRNSFSIEKVYEQQIAKVEKDEQYYFKITLWSNTKASIFTNYVQIGDIYFA